MAVFLSTAYLPPVEYFAKIFFSDKIYIEGCENYQKQSYRNRCTILSANGVIPLSVPIERYEALKCPIRDVQIADHGNWRHIHWNALVSAYNSTPFFEYYRDDFQPFYERKFKYLFDFNEELRILISHLLGVEDREVLHTDDYKTILEEDEPDFRETIHPKKDWRQLDPDFVPVPYYQVFEDRFGFVPNLSIVDLLFNMGNESLIVLQESGEG